MAHDTCPNCGHEDRVWPIHRPEDRPSDSFVSAREAALDEQADLYDYDYDDYEEC